ncbi:hypothetical protein SEA_YAGO84_32 [Gordonia phage Yago84]|nr:hypothetical protein SEA_YAGO84_32 [Gordonia phage Yago84]QIG58960.1 hypothetical protein SEA_ANCLAR_33 [Gordonia phage AnClar]WIC90014.1 hypothetical protein SEA_SISKO_32 [Gordonia phage Sisko]
MFDPPPGDADLQGDVELTDEPDTGYRELTVEALKLTLQARRPSPRSCHAIAMAANAKLGAERQADHLTLFLRQNLSEESYREVLSGMMSGELPADALQEVARALSTWGTARPTRR